MDLIVIIGLAVGLSLDALAVSIANGYMIKQLKFHHAFRISAFFGLFQAGMPLAGWSAGLHFSSYIQKFDHWIAFCLLVFIGGKMIFESKKLGKECESKNCTHFPTLLLLSFATSIDALAVGLSFAILNMSILMPIAIIGIITFTVCIIGVYVGNRLGHVFENKLELSGGIILVGIGIRILAEHLIKHI